MNKHDFHIPFIKSLILVAVVTIVSMQIADYFIYKCFFPGLKTPSFTSQKSQDNTESSFVK